MLLTPECWKRRCKHLQGVISDNESDSNPEENERNVCDAFPDGIPDEIAYGDNPHTSPFPGDNGIQFEPEA